MTALGAEQLKDTEYMSDILGNIKRHFASIVHQINTILYINCQQKWEIDTSFWFIDLLHVIPVVLFYALQEKSKLKASVV